MSNRHPYRATFAGTCSACGRPRAALVHDMSTALLCVRCPFCGVELDAVGDDVSIHFHNHHQIILCRRGAREGVWTQEAMDEWLEIINDLKQRRREGADGSS